MWSDNETSEDLLGFKVHADLLVQVIEDETILPVTIGLFADWGGGKSSIMKMIMNELEKEDNKSSTICLYFNGWSFEGYEDAKSALISSILVQLGEHKTWKGKIKDEVVGLLKRVQWMNLAKYGIKHIGIPLVAGALTGGAGTIPAVLGSIINPEKFSNQKDEEKNKKDNSLNWSELINADSSQPDILDVRKFREDFGKLIKKTEIKCLVVLIDDLDRCLPDRIIDTLEAIKLFVSVPNTAFIIGADPRIVRHAIATRFNNQSLIAEKLDEAKYDIVDDYLEKLIQIPYSIPRLSPTEIETYMNLLACKRYLKDDEFKNILSDLQKKREEDALTSYRYADIKSILSENINQDLKNQLLWSYNVAEAITEGLKGNPRQVKRMLNAMILRKRLAVIAKLDIRDDVLAKLMVLEYSFEEMFKVLNDWQTSEKGFPQNIKNLEKMISEGDDTKEPKLQEWNRHEIKAWLRLEPQLSTIDLRDYFWLARDRTESLKIGQIMTSSNTKKILNQLMGNDGEQNIGARNSNSLTGSEKELLLELLTRNTKNNPKENNGIKALQKLITNKFPNASKALIEIMDHLPINDISPAWIIYLGTIRDPQSQSKDEIDKLLNKLAKSEDKKIKTAAHTALGGK